MTSWWDEIPKLITSELIEKLYKEWTSLGNKPKKFQIFESGSANDGRHKNRAQRAKQRHEFNEIEDQRENDREADFDFS